MAAEPGRRERLLDAAIEIVGVQGLSALTHRAVDAAAGVPTGTTSNYWRTRQALLDALVDRVVARYALLVEAAQHEDVRPRLAAGGQRVNARLRAWMRLVGSAEPDHDMHV